MKKSIRPVSILRIVWLLIWIFLICISVCGVVLICIEREFDLIKILAIILAIPIMIISLFIFCADFKRGVIFEEKCLKVSADAADKWGLIVRRLQHSLEVDYNDIEAVYTAYSNKDSNNKPLKHVFVAMPYIVIECKDGSKKAINVYYYNKKQKIKLIDEIRQRTADAGNPVNCVSGQEMWA